MKKILIGIMCIVIFVSCDLGQETPPSDYLVDNTWSSLFDAYWHAMDDNYVFWSLDSPGREWDAVHEAYMPLFEDLGTIGAETAELGASYFYEIAEDLDDMHYSFDLYDESGNLILYFSSLLNRHLEELGYTREEILDAFTDIDGAYSDLYFDERYGVSEMGFESTDSIMSLIFALPIAEEDGLRRELYLTSETDDGVDSLVSRCFDRYVAYAHYNYEAGVWIYILLGKSSDGVVYFAFSHFYFSYALYGGSEWDSRMIGILETFNDWLLEDDTSGLIIDLRGNTGGYNGDIPLLWGRIADEPFTYMLERTKMGDSRLDYTSWVPIMFQPDEDGLCMDKTLPIAILVNRASASNSDVTIMMMKALQEMGRNVVIIGSTSAGATGAIWENDVYNAGDFELPPFLPYVQTAIVQVCYKDGTMYEGVGIPADIAIPFDFNAFITGDDDRLRAAFSYVRGTFSY